MEEGATEPTNLHAWYLGKGGNDCKGCYWGMDLPPLETMFVHYYTSPGFSHGEVKAYSEMDTLLDGPLGPLSAEALLQQSRRHAQMRLSYRGNDGTFALSV
mmetsp:Transcript_47499/g.94879  ORF Transcript_47499/g.94879 Transcript_47499/m.94879 type:complete len:101 (-) Transcript_47499:179-481(-)